MGKGDSSLWAYVVILLRRDYVCSTAALLAVIALMALPEAVAAAVLGWVLQAFVVILWSVVRRRLSGSGTVPPLQRTSGEQAATADYDRNAGLAELIVAHRGRSG
jgi:hypothetical protein